MSGKKYHKSDETEPMVPVRAQVKVKFKVKEKNDL